MNFSCPSARKARVEPQNGQFNPVKRWNKQNCALGRSSRKSILKKYKAIPEAKEHNNIMPHSIRKIKEEEIFSVFNLPVYSMLLPPEIVSGCRFNPKNKKRYGYRQTTAIGHS